MKQTKAIRIQRYKGIWQYRMTFNGKSYQAKRRRPLLRILATYRLKQELGL